MSPYIRFPVQTAREDAVRRQRPDEDTGPVDTGAAVPPHVPSPRVSDTGVYFHLEQAAYGVGEKASAHLDRVGVQILAALYAGDLTDHDARTLILTAITRCQLVEEEARKYTRNHHTLADEVVARVYESMLSKVVDPDVCGALDTSRNASIAGWARASIRNLVRQKTRDVRRAESTPHIDAEHAMDRLDIDEAIDEIHHRDEDEHALRSRMLVDEWSEGVRDAVATGYALLRVPPALRPRSFQLRKVLAHAIDVDAEMRAGGTGGSLAHRSLAAFASGTLHYVGDSISELVGAGPELDVDILVAALSDLWLGYDADTCAVIESLDDAEAWTSFLAADALAQWTRPSVKRIRTMSGALARLFPGRDWQRLVTCLLDAFLAHEFEPTGARERLGVASAENLDAYCRSIASRFEDLCTQVAEHKAHPLGATPTDVADMLHVLGADYLESPGLIRFLPQRAVDPVLAAEILHKARRPGPRPVDRETPASVEARVAALRIVDGGRTTLASVAALRAAAALKPRDGEAFDRLFGKGGGLEASGVA